MEVSMDKIPDEYDLRRERDKIEKELKKIPHFIAS